MAKIISVGVYKGLSNDWEVLMLNAYLEGSSDQEVAFELKMTMPAFKRLYTNDPHFHEQVEIGRGYAQAWWYKQGRANLKDKTFNAALWFNQMRNKYGWSEKVEIADTTKLENITDEELQKQIDLELQRRNKVG